MSKETAEQTIPLAAPSKHTAWLSWVSGAFASILVVFIYLFVLFLIRFAPNRRLTHEDPVCEKDMSISKKQSMGSHLITGSVALYRHSLVHRYMHRKGERCLFVPSCSEYAKRAGQKYGLYNGLILIGNRFRRCRADYKGDFVDFP